MDCNLASAGSCQPSPSVAAMGLTINMTVWPIALPRSKQKPLQRSCGQLPANGERLPWLVCTRILSSRSQLSLCMEVERIFADRLPMVSASVASFYNDTRKKQAEYDNGCHVPCLCSQWIWNTTIVGNQAFAFEGTFGGFP